MAYSCRFGIEEEYFLADRATGAACGAPSADFWADIAARAPEASKELLQSQVEARTPPCSSGAEAVDALVANRNLIDKIAAGHGLGLMACGTHPDFDWREGSRSHGLRYARLERDMRMLALRNQFCGLHVHVEIPPQMSRVALMNRCAPFIPLFLALSVSSPFWRGEWTGMHGYRLTGYDELPRTGAPPVFATDADYEGYLEVLCAIGAVPDASYLWWAIRPSLRHPTLELRICDSMTDLGAVAVIAELYRCLVLRLMRDKDFGPAPSPVLRALAEENRWQIQCDGLGAQIVDVATLRPISVRDAIASLARDLAEDARAVGAAGLEANVEALLAAPTSAERQLQVFADAAASGAAPQECIAAVNAWILKATATLA